MRSDQNAQPQNQNADFNSGINMLPGYNGGGAEWNQEVQQSVEPQTIQGRPLPEPSFIPSPSAVAIPRATPVSQQTDLWRNNAGSFRNNYPVPGTPLSYPVPGTPYSGAPLQDPQGFFARLLNSITNGVGGIGDLFGHLGGGQPPPRPAAQPGPGAFGMSIFQSHFPGSLIGPTSGLVTNAYQNSSTPLGGRQPLGGPAPGYATAFSNTVKARNII